MTFRKDSCIILLNTMKNNDLLDKWGLGVMKKLYLKPYMKSEQFRPDEYFSACWYGPCNAKGYIFSDENHNGIVDGNDKYLYKNTPCNDDGFFIRGVDTKPLTDAIVFSDDQLNFSGNLIFGYTVTVKDDQKDKGTPAWHYKDVHTSTNIELQTRPNHS